MLTPRDRRSENIGIEAIIIAKLELCNVEMQILFADVVESSDNPALDERPETLNRVGMHGANNILTSPSQ
jgi:hypothetical protein